MDFLDEHLTPLPTMVVDKYAILDLEQAFHVDGRQLFYGLDRCKRDNIVIVSDKEGKQWVRGEGRMKYRVMMTGEEKILGPFPAGSVRRDNGR